MAEKPERLNRIEETQAALRDCIEKAKKLVEQSERLVRRHRDETPERDPPDPAP